MDRVDRNVFDGDVRIRFSPPVQRALGAGAPAAPAVVAVESTVIAHGLPYPESAALVASLRHIIEEDHGCVMAIVAVLDGVVHVGLDERQMERLVRSAAPDAAEKFIKCGRRDLVGAVVQKRCGATTVSATMAIAHWVGIPVVLTGGIGGVHRSVAGDIRGSLDVSADLPTLAQLPVCVVCAGIKSVLDVGATLERLETDSVPVVVLGADRFPAFWQRESAWGAPLRLDTVEEVATLVRAHWETPRVFGREQVATMTTTTKAGGVLVAVPIPAADACPDVEAVVQRALQEAATQRLSGKQVTPFLLRRVAAHTGKASVRANVSLLCNNARVAAVLARALRGDRVPGRFSGVPRLPVTVIGGLALDIHAQCHALGNDTNMPWRRSHPGRIRLSVGGVAHNIAAVLCGLAGQRAVPHFYSATVQGDGEAVLLDPARWMAERALAAAAATAAPTPRPLALYTAVHDAHRDMLAAVFDGVDVPPEQVKRLPTPLPIVFDANLSPEAMRALPPAQRFWYEPTSPAKAPRIVQAGVLPSMPWVSPNVEEMVAMAKALTGSVETDGEAGRIQWAGEALILRGGVRNVLCTRGSRGVSWFRAEHGAVRRVDMPAVPVEAGRLRSTSGAGDAFAAGVLYGLLCMRYPREEEAIALGLRVAATACECEDTVPCKEALVRALEGSRMARL
ncbi:hypothetical protein CDCA_CDCA19G4693 [Cyanidium caldarium]|uniref:Carbohydrate kinase PfkB domain-containing protein n=1 Tax=Cyanidium caldarium TaxID=2771 RepID=A0AAV9J3S2_CYACA|nr:hypothetical protein CDCA_CDCA19G4693 [Cyanidium caldarium]